ncbi:YybS family protein [Pseudalkalibacillus sp. R45]|uniref:YybS family protein n=1 Tax=Pseudalkalibacillus sp. R45 TaxID=3457433 RepID=UPI003FCDFC37
MNRTRALTEGAILASLYAVLFLITLFLPVLSLFTIFLLSLPYAIYTVRHGLKKSMVFVLTTMVLTIILGSVTAINVPILFGSVGVVMGHLYRKKISAFGLLAGAALTYLANFILIYVVSILLLEINLIDTMKQSIEETIVLTEKFSGAMGGDAEATIQQLRELVEIVPYLIPALFVILSVVFALASIFVTNLIMKRFRVEVPHWEPFRNWSFPKSIIWYYLATILLYMTNPEQGSALYIVTMNLYIVLEIVLAIQGLAFIYFYFWVKKKGKTIPVLVTISLFIIPVGLHVVRILGIIDLGFDLRKRIKPEA